MRSKTYIVQNFTIERFDNTNNGKSYINISQKFILFDLKKYIH